MGAADDYHHHAELGGDEEEALLRSQAREDDFQARESRRVWIVLSVLLLVAILGLGAGFASGLLYSKRGGGTITRQEEFPLNFLVLGDWGRNGFYNQSLVASQMGRVGELLDIDFVISVGDNFYDTGLTGVDDPKFSTSFSRIYTAPSLQRPWYAILGNHDYMGDALAQLDPIMTQRDSRWYCRREFEMSLSLCGNLNRGDCASSVDFFFIDTSPFIDEYWMPNATQTFDWRELAPRQEQLRSQVERLDRILESSRATWKIVVGHHTMHSFGHHGDSVELLEYILPVLEAHNVDAYINGHDHCLEDIKHSDSNIHFITSGAGSKAWQGIRPATVANGLHFAYDGQGFVSASVGRTSLLFKFYDAFGNVLHTTFLRK